MYKSRLNRFILSEIVGTIIYLFLLIVSNDVFAVECALKIIYEVFICFMVIILKIYMDHHNNIYIEKNYNDLFLKYKSKVYDFSKNLLSFEIFLDIKNDVFEIEKNSDLYNVAKEGLHFIVLECINFIIMFMNFVFITTTMIFK